MKNLPNFLHLQANNIVDPGILRAVLQDLQFPGSLQQCAL